MRIGETRSQVLYKCQDQLRRSVARQHDAAMRESSEKVLRDVLPYELVPAGLSSGA